MFSRVCFVLCLTLLAACGDGAPTPFALDPAAPLEAEDRVEPVSSLPEGPYCKPVNGTYTQGLKIASQGRRSPQGNFFAEGGGCIQRPISEIWEVLRTAPGVKWKEARVTQFKPLPAMAPVAWAFEARYANGWIARWIMEWRHTPVAGTADDPEYVVVKYQRVSGIVHIEAWEGAIDLKRLDDDWTSVAQLNEIRGSGMSGIDVTKAVGGLTDLYNNMTSLRTQ